MTETLHYIEQSLKGIFPENEIRCFSRILFEKVCGIPPYRLLVDKDKKLSDTEKREITAIVERLQQAEPLQYILGEADFYGMTFSVNPDVLIPRPETEELVELILTRHKKEKHRILDVGTGSGCIAISLAKNLATSTVFAADISEKALQTARINAVRNQVDIRFIQTNILSKEAETEIPGSYSILVSNPPYVKNSEKADMEKNVLEYEPHLALFVPDNDPLQFYRAIARFGKTKLTNNGFLYVEINAQYGPETVEMLKEEGYHNIFLKQDISGKNRIIEAQR